MLTATINTVSTNRGTEWSEADVETMVTMFYQGCTSAQMAIALGRTKSGIKNKLRLWKLYSYAYGAEHQAEKVDATKRFIDSLNLKETDVVVDCMCGINKIHEQLAPNSVVISNDLNKKIPDLQYRMDANKLMVHLRETMGPDSCKLVDVDPFGTSAPFVDNALELVAKGGGLILTDGFIEMVRQRRWQTSINKDYSKIRTVYGITKPEDINIEFIMKTLNKRAAKFGKKLEVSELKVWMDSNLWRIYIKVI